MSMDRLLEQSTAQRGREFTPKAPEEGVERPAERLPPASKPPLVKPVIEPGVKPTPDGVEVPQAPYDVKAVERVLEEGLDEIYKDLPAGLKEQFRRVGEETANAVYGLLHEVKVNVSKILDLIRRWLSLIPDVSRFFLEQETKIKTDKLMQLRRPSQD